MVVMVGRQGRSFRAQAQPWYEDTIDEALHTYANRRGAKPQASRRVDVGGGGGLRPPGCSGRKFFFAVRPGMFQRFDVFHQRHGGVVTGLDTR